MIRIWHGALAAVITFALVGQLVLTVDKNRSAVNFFSYFTIESNILILIASVLIAIRPQRESLGWGVFRIAGLAGITITGIVYVAVLRQTADFSGIEWWYDKLFHYVAPIGAVLGWLLFVPRTRFAWVHVWWFVIWPIAWLAYTLLRAAVMDPVFSGLDADAKSQYPYPFLDADVHSYGIVALNSAAITVALLAVCGAYVWLGRYFERPQRSADTAVT